MRILASGISGGIGQAFQQRAARHSGWSLQGLARTPQPGQTRCDVTWAQERINRVMEPMDALLCLHGADIVSPPLRNASYQDRLDALYAVDMAGTVKLVRSALPHLSAGGTIIVMGWDHSELGAAGEFSELYALAKGALTSWAKSLAATCMNQVSVYVVAPGWVLTRWGETLSADRRQRIAARTRSGRWQTPDEIAAVIESLLTFPSGLSTGQVIYVNRGDVMPS